MWLLSTSCNPIKITRSAVIEVESFFQSSACFFDDEISKKIKLCCERSLNRSYSKKQIYVRILIAYVI